MIRVAAQTGLSPPSQKKKKKNSVLALVSRTQAAAIAMASTAAAASRTRQLSSIFSSTTPRSNLPKPAHAPKAAAAKAGAKSNEDRDPESKRALNKFVKVIFREHDPDKLVSEFIAASTSSARFRDTERLYEVAVSRLFCLGRHDAVAAIIDSQKPFVESSSVAFAARLVRLYGSASMPSHAAATFSNLPPKHKTVLTFTALLAAYVDSGDFDAVATAFQQIPASHPTIVPNVCSYNVLIRALRQKPDLSAALDVIPLMEKRGITPDVVSFNALLNGFYNHGRFDDAKKVWEMMEERNVEPDAKSYGAKLRALVSQGSVEDAIALVERMQKDGPKPDTVCYNELIRGLCKEGRLDEAKKVYLDLGKNQSAPNSGTFYTLVPRCVEAGDLDLAVSCCHEILRRKCRVQCSLLQGVVTALVAASRVEEAKRIVELGRLSCYPRKDLRIHVTEKATV
ncbi:hypothetical protein BS78_03G300400 [Paspalum vaginatum]|nr:hypothetical protein BS78_03G300400 [Paspalum vaginatum]